jgi:phage terminase large subunit GpA-like protein
MRTITFTPGERRIFELKEPLSVSQWAEKYRFVHGKPIPGPWRNSVSPWLVEPMDTCGLPWVRVIILCFAPQVGKTQVAFNFMLYRIDREPGPMMYVMPDEKVTKRIAKRRIVPTFRATPRIAELLSPYKEDTTSFYVRFQNGADLMLTWATSAAELASESVQDLFLDETDKYPEFAGREADPSSLAEIRTKMFPYTKKIIKLSTPAAEPSIIWTALHEEADEVRRYHAKCPICGTLQEMKFRQFNWPKDAEPGKILHKRLATYQCVDCGMLWDDHTRTVAVNNGQWVTEGTPVHRPRAVGFGPLPSWYASVTSLSEPVSDYLKGKTDLAKRIYFITQHKAQQWKETIAPKEESWLLEHRGEHPPQQVPEEALALTAGIDMQKRGFWYVVRAWAEDLTNWLVDYGNIATFNDVYDLVFNTMFMVEGSDKRRGIWRAGIDTGGGDTDNDELTRTEECYQWLVRNGQGVIFGTKGASQQQINRVRLTVIDKMPRSHRPIPGGLELRLLDTHFFKSLIHSRLERKREEPQYFYLHSETTEEYTRQLLAEELRRDRKGRHKWKQIGGRPNHLLDCEVIAAACAYREWQPSFQMLAERLKNAIHVPVQTHKPETPEPRRIIDLYKRPSWLR